MSALDVQEVAWLTDAALQGDFLAAVRTADKATAAALLLATEMLAREVLRVLPTAASVVISGHDDEGRGISAICDCGGAVLVTGDELEELLLFNDDMRRAEEVARDDIAALAHLRNDSMVISLPVGLAR